MNKKLWQSCRKCDLHRTRRCFVFGKGQYPADVCLIGEAPGEEEDKEGVPFVGRAGKVLDAALDCVEVELGRSLPRIYILNTVCCRPTKIVDGNVRNRAPFPNEIEACRNRLLYQMEFVNPQLILFLGRVPENTCEDLWPDIFSMYVWHPSYVLRNGGIFARENEYQPMFVEYVETLAKIFKKLVERS